MENKKIAIMTWYTYNNYGSVLQAYALKEKIKNLGYEKVDFVQYMPYSPRVNILKRITIRKIKEKFFLKKGFNKTLLKEKEIKFNNFRSNYFSLSKKCNNSTELFELNDIYDKFICGSDQIWAPTVYDENYFLDFVSNDSKKIAYAPSIGLPSIENKHIKEKMCNLIKRINYLSVREEQGKRIIKDITGMEACVVLDPTLLFDKTEWNNKLKLQNKSNKYLVYYCLRSSKKNLKIAKKIANKLELELRIIPTQILDYKSNNIENCSPQEFLKLIFNASMVITDSLHGVLFSINFNIPFIAFKRFKDNNISQNSRIYNILKKVNLEKRIYENNIKFFINNPKIDFSSANKIIEKERKKSIDFLTASLKNENDSSKYIISNRCTGCGICELICPKKCIDIKLNEDGFYSYTINDDICIKCNKCKTVCAQYNSNPRNIGNMSLYSAYSNNDEILMSSSSGGIAHEISLWGLKNDFPIIGCTYDVEKGFAKHIKIEEYIDVTKLDGSKYIQSFTKEGFEKLKFMNKGIVIGTPCQIASVDRYLNTFNKRDSFILIDLICHGVPSLYVWKKYISTYKNVHEVKFRDKKYDWRNMTISVNSNKHYNEKNDYFYHIFNSAKTYNESCYDCKYRTQTSADIRIGDYWGPKFKNNKKGVSMVILATDRRRKSF